MARIPFAVTSYRHRDLPISAQRVINWMAEQEPADARSKLVLLPTPGLRLFTTLPTGPLRGAKVMGSYLYMVAGTGVYRLDVAGSVTVLGNIADGGQVSMDHNGTQMAIVVPETRQGWVATSSTLTQITDTDFPGAVAVTTLDGYGVFVRPDSTQIFISALNDMTSFDALDYASAEGDPDNLVTALRVGRELWLFGERTTEVWANVGAADFPFQRISGAFVERGIAARFSVAQQLAVPLWLGENRVAYRANGVQPQRISTHAIEQEWAGYTTVNDARSFLYEQEGHTFFGITFPTEGATWVYDLDTQVWHERESEGYDTWRATNCTAFAGAVIAGDTTNGNIYVVDPTSCDENGETIIRVATGTQFVQSGNKVRHVRLTMDLTTGNGLSAGQGSDPQIWLTSSDDGGRTFGNEKWRSLGGMGEYQARVIFSRLGASRQRVYRLQMSDPVRCTLMAMDLDAEPGAN